MTEENVAIWLICAPRWLRPQTPRLTLPRSELGRALERLALDWSTVAGNAKWAVYAVAHDLRPKDEEGEFTFIGTNFAVAGRVQKTSAQIVAT